MMNLGSSLGGMPLATVTAAPNPMAIWQTVQPIVGAIAIFLVGWLVATFVANGVGQLLRRANLDRYLANSVNSGPSLSIWRMAKTAVFWFIILMSVVFALNVLNLTTASAPLNGFLGEIWSYLPRIASAAILGMVAWVIATVAKMLVVNTAHSWDLDAKVDQQLDHSHPTPENLGSLHPFDRDHSRNDSSQHQRRPAFSNTVGNVIYGFVFLLFAPLVLDALGLQSSLPPVQNLLSQVLNAGILIATASAIVGVAFFVGRYVADLVTDLLDRSGFNGMFRLLGVEPPAAGGKTPSQIGGMVTLVAIMLFAVVTATNVLNIAPLTAIVATFTVLLGQVLFGLALFFVGVYFANLAYRIISSSGSAQARILAQIARVTILTLVSAVALIKIGVNESTINLVIGLILGAVAIASAIAFGLGGREVAGKHLDRWLSSFQALDQTPQANRNSGQTGYGQTGYNNPGQPMPRYNKSDE